MKLIDGKKISEKVLDEIKFSVQNRVKNNLKIPHLAAILVGDDGAREEGGRHRRGLKRGGQQQGCQQIA